MSYPAGGGSTGSRSAGRSAAFDELFRRPASQPTPAQPAGRGNTPGYYNDPTLLSGRGHQPQTQHQPQYSSSADYSNNFNHARRPPAQAGHPSGYPTAHDNAAMYQHRTSYYATPSSSVNQQYFDNAVASSSVAAAGYTQTPPQPQSHKVKPGGPYYHQGSTGYSSTPATTHQSNFASPRSSYSSTMSSTPTYNPTTSSMSSQHAPSTYPSSTHSHHSASATNNFNSPVASTHSFVPITTPPAPSPVPSLISLPPNLGPPRLPELARDEFFGFDNSNSSGHDQSQYPRDDFGVSELGWTLPQGHSSTMPPGAAASYAYKQRAGSPGSVYEDADSVQSHPPSVYNDRPTYGGSSYDLHSRRSSADSDRNSLYGTQAPRPLAPVHPTYSSTASLPYPHYANNGSPSGSIASINLRRSSESMRVIPTQSKPFPPGQDHRAASFSAGERPNMRSLDSVAQQRPFSTASATSTNQVVQRRAPVVYPALLSRVAEAFKARIILGERVKDGLVYPDTFDGRDAVDKIAYIIKTSDRNLALLLGRALDAQKFFHDVTYDHRLRDSPVELYQFRERLSSPFLSADDLALQTEDYRNRSDLPLPLPRRNSVTDTLASSEDSFPSGVFTLLTDCYSPTCTRDRLCYSIACPRRLEQQARLNLKPKPGLQRSLSTESLGDLREPGSLWIHSVPQEIADSTPDKEKRRQEALNEIFYTERDFVRDLEYLRDCWIKPLRTQNIIPEDRREDFVTQVFWNVLEILAVNIRLAELLNKRQKSGHVVEKIGDIFLELVPHFGPFVKYGAHQLYGKYEFEKEKGSNPAFAKFVEATERLPESRKLELNGYLTKPTTRLARYPLLLEACLKHTADDNPDKVILPKVVKLVREFLNKVNVESGKSENRFNLAQLDQQLIFKSGEAVDLRLRDEDREMIHKGPLKKRGGTQSESAELQVFLFDHAILMVKQKSKNEQYKVYRKPIPLELLVVAPIDDPATARTGAVRPKSLMARGTATKYLSHPPPGVDKNSKQGFALTFIHLGRRGYQITLWAASWSGRKKWLEKIEGRQHELRERSLVFETLPLSAGYFVGTNRVTCAAPFDNGNRMVYGTDNGVYLSDLREKNKVPIKVISVPNVTQLDVLEEQGILIVLADKAVQTFFVDHLDPGDAIGAAKRARKISSHATFFKAGQCLGRTLVCVVKSGSVSSTIKTLEPVDQARGKKQPAIRKFLQGSNESLRVFKEFYIPTESSSIHFLKSKLCVGCTKGFEIVDLETLDTQGLLDPADSSLDFVHRRENARPIAIYRIDGEFLLCYDEFAFYVNKNGWRAKSNWIIQWEGYPTTFALHYPYVLAFEPTFIEVRHVDSGALMQIIPGNSIKCLFADTPPSASSSSYFSAPNAAYGYRGQMPPTAGRSEIIVSDSDKCFSLQFTAATV